jgi:tetratricopeptide (TPR) repeat protein
MSNQTAELGRNIAAYLLLAVGVGFIIVRSVQKAEDPPRMIFKWVVTALMVWVMFKLVAPMVTDNPVMGLPLLGFCGIVFVIVWRRSLTMLVASPLASLYDGGTQPPDPRPAYSVAYARQKQGRYLEAIDHIRQQLQRFPRDVEGQLLLAQLQAENLNDLEAAALTIERFCAQPNHAPQNVAFALYSLADWQLQFGKDIDAAHRSLEKIVELLPESEYALGAAQRIAHLTTPELLEEKESGKKFKVTEGIKNLGLLREQPSLPTPEKPAEMQAAEYVKHLEEHPLDMEARERLAVLYADHYGRLDLATDQLEQMIQQPHQPGRLVVHWLNLLADLQVRGGASVDAVRATIQRIIDRDPSYAAAEVARKRLELLNLEFKVKEKPQAVQLGKYEQNIGLKRGGPGGFRQTS